MTSQEILLKAAEYIQENGWHQGESYDINHAGGPGDDSIPEVVEWVLRARPPACAIGAICAAVFEMGELDPTSSSRKAELILKAQVGECVPDFNDHPDTTAEDVILALKKAAEL